MGFKCLEIVRIMGYHVQKNSKKDVDQQCKFAIDLKNARPQMSTSIIADIAFDWFRSKILGNPNPRSLIGESIDPHLLQVVNRLLANVVVVDKVKIGGKRKCE